MDNFLKKSFLFIILSCTSMLDFKVIGQHSHQASTVGAPNAKFGFRKSPEGFTFTMGNKQVASMNSLARISNHFPKDIQQKDVTPERRGKDFLNRNSVLPQSPRINERNSITSKNSRIRTQRNKVTFVSRLPAAVESKHFRDLPNVAHSSTPAKSKENSIVSRLPMIEKEFEESNSPSIDDLVGGFSAPVKPKTSRTISINTGKSEPYKPANRFLHNKLQKVSSPVRQSSREMSRQSNEIKFKSQPRRKTHNRHSHNHEGKLSRNAAQRVKENTHFGTANTLRTNTRRQLKTIQNKTKKKASNKRLENLRSGNNILSNEVNEILFSNNRTKTKFSNARLRKPNIQSPRKKIEVKSSGKQSSVFRPHRPVRNKIAKVRRLNHLNSNILDTPLLNFFKVNSLKNVLHSVDNKHGEGSRENARQNIQNVRVSEERVRQNIQSRNDMRVLGDRLNHNIQSRNNFRTRQNSQRRKGSDISRERARKKPRQNIKNRQLSRTRPRNNLPGKAVKAVKESARLNAKNRNQFGVREIARQNVQSRKDSNNIPLVKIENKRLPSSPLNNHGQFFRKRISQKNVNVLSEKGAPGDNLYFEDNDEDLTLDEILGFSMKDRTSTSKIFKPPQHSHVQTVPLWQSQNNRSVVKPRKSKSSSSSRKQNKIKKPKTLAPIIARQKKVNKPKSNKKRKPTTAAISQPLRQPKEPIKPVVFNRVSNQKPSANIDSFQFETREIKPNLKHVRKATATSNKPNVDNNNLHQPLNFNANDGSSGIRNFNVVSRTANELQDKHVSPQRQPQVLQKPTNNGQRRNGNLDNILGLSSTKIREPSVVPVHTASRPSIRPVSQPSPSQTISGTLTGSPLTTDINKNSAKIGGAQINFLWNNDNVSNKLPKDTDPRLDNPFGLTVYNEKLEPLTFEELLVIMKDEGLLD